MRRLIESKKQTTMLLAFGVMLLALNTGMAYAQQTVALEASPPPPALQELQEQSVGDKPDKSSTVGLQIRGDALREAALSYGARGGLASRTFEIQRRLVEHQTSLGKTFDFNKLLISAPSGLLIEPPIVSEAQRAVLVGSSGQEAAVADRIFRINQAARIVTAPRDWRLYLERDWGRVDPPPSLLLPKDKDERELWRQLVQEGWDAGIEQAQEIFEADLDRLTNDFVGMVRYRELLAQGMISPPYAMHEDRGVTGGGKEMRVGDRGVAITGPSVLIPRSQMWTTTPQQ
ncbi:MAG: type IV secretion system DotC family protein [Alphaproteobacteria bacterium]|nr:type IV secretion system DotC family protein [Alphaproteobacteria bacterium]